MTKPPRHFFAPLASGAPEPLRELPVRLERMIHFVPAHNEKLRARVGDMAKQVDVILANLEDAIPADAKDAARAGAIEMGKSFDFAGAGVGYWARINALNSPWHLDDVTELVAAIGNRLDVIMVPKVEDVDHVRAAAELELPLVLLLESARGIERAFELARAHPWARWLAFGPLDLLADIGGQWTPEGEETLFARQVVPIAARAARLRGALDGPWPPLRDLDGLRTDTARGRRMGFVGRVLIHPDQIAVVRQVFAPSAEELAYARKVVEAARRAVAEGRGAIAVDGRFVDPPVVRWAEQVVAAAEG